MNRYRISYTRDEAERVCIRKADSALDAGKKLMHQHGWYGFCSCHDTDTHGKTWAKFSVEMGPRADNIIMEVTAI